MREIDPVLRPIRRRPQLTPDERKHAQALPGTLHELHASQIEWSRQQAESFQEYMRRARDPLFIAEGGWPER